MITFLSQLFLGIHAALTFLALAAGVAAISVFIYELRADMRARHTLTAHRKDEYTVLDE